MSNLSKVSMVELVCRSEDGTVDIESTVAKFKVLVENWDLQNSADLEVTTKEMFEVFAFYKNPEMSINTPALVSAVAKRLGIDQILNKEAFATCEERVKDILKSNPAFVVGKGRNGGVRLAKAEEKTETKAA